MSGPAAGLLGLRFAIGPDRRTRLVEREYRFPLRFTTPMYLDPVDTDMAFVYVQNPSGGVFAGDRLRTRLQLEEQSHVHLTTQSATKVYRMDGGQAWQGTEARLAPGSYLEIVPDLLIPHAGSRLLQELTVQLAGGACFFGMEALAPGRLARGEAFAYSRLELRARVLNAAGAELLVDTLVFEPDRRSPRRRGLAGPYPYVGSALVLAPERDPDELARALNAAVSTAADAVAATGALPDDIGMTVRVLSHSSRGLRDALDGIWRAAREVLIGVPPPRRRK